MLTLAAALVALAAHVAHAENAKPAAAPAQAPASSQTPAPTRTATPTAPATPQGATAPAAAPALSESKFLGALYTAIAKQTPTESPAGEGEVTASFHVNAQGKIDKVTIDKTSSPALAEAVKKILSSVEAPPPPGGSMDVGQTFKFRGTPN
ncbi:energy transducer TonB [Methylocystis sp.]|uniref:energy transducer TonB family protein n=1 Tax=Methylocystis sp. TaxID=1911079 RepID=UPI0025F8AEFC|nr:energy transducer TonB [Methylocystis sp.]